MKSNNKREKKLIMKKVIALLLIFIMILTTVTYADSNVTSTNNKQPIYSDIKTTDWFYKNVLDLVQKM